MPICLSAGQPPHPHPGEGKEKKRKECREKKGHKSAWVLGNLRNKEVRGADGIGGKKREGLERKAEREGGKTNTKKRTLKFQK